jgi:hypothetical protein
VILENKIEMQKSPESVFAGSGDFCVERSRKTGEGRRKNACHETKICV